MPYNQAMVRGGG